MEDINTLNEIFNKILLKANEIAGTAEQIAEGVENGDLNKDTRHIPIMALQHIYNTCKQDLVMEQEREKQNKPIKKFLFIEDGSVDMEELHQTLSMTNPEIKIIVYRQNANKPELRDIGENQ